MPEPMPSLVSKTLLSYDVSGEARSLAVRVCHLVFGRPDAAEGSPPPYALRPGVVWVGQSVLLLPHPVAEELADELRRLGARVATADVRIEPGDLQVFRRGTRTRSRERDSGSPPQA